MNKISYLVILLIIIVSCSDKKDKQNFENALGKENIETLDYLVKSFEDDYLRVVYPEKDVKDAYEEFVKLVLDNNINHNDIALKLEKAIHVYDNSRLKYEKIKVVDSVWILDSLNNIVSLKMRYKFIDSINQFNYLYNNMKWSLKTESLDSILYKSKNTVSPNYQGKYIKAIKELNSRSLFFRNFNEIIDAAGASDYGLTSDLMIRRQVDYDDYFIKRVVVLEIVY